MDKEESRQFGNMKLFYFFSHYRSVKLLQYLYLFEDGTLPNLDKKTSFMNIREKMFFIDHKVRVVKVRNFYGKKIALQLHLP